MLDITTKIPLRRATKDLIIIIMVVIIIIINLLLLVININFSPSCTKPKSRESGAALPRKKKSNIVSQI